MVAEPAETPVTTAEVPLPLTEATEPLLVLQVPPPSGSPMVMLDPIQTEEAPVMARGAGLTVTTALPVSVPVQLPIVALVSA